MEISKDFQLFILNEIAKVYPASSINIFEFLAEHAKGETKQEKIEYVATHAKLLADMGYLENVRVELGAYGVVKYNTDYTISTAGLQAVGIDLLHPNPYQELIDVLVAKAVQENQISPTMCGSLKATLATLSKKTLDKLADKGLEALISLLVL